MRQVTHASLKALRSNPQRVDNLSRERLLALLTWSDAHLGTADYSADYADLSDEGLREVLLIQLADDYYIRNR